MSNSDQCSPLPWVVSYAISDVLVESRSGDIYVTERSEADDNNAALIVRAVNSHAELLAALELLVDDTVSYFGTGRQPKYLDAAVIKARLAIAKAKS